MISPMYYNIINHFKEDIIEISPGTQVIFTLEKVVYLKCERISNDEFIFDDDYKVSYDDIIRLL